jgi:hypothetical protein
MKESSQSGEPEGNSTEGNTIININIQKENYVLTRCTHERTNTTLTILDTLQKEKKMKPSCKTSTLEVTTLKEST